MNNTDLKERIQAMQDNEGMYLCGDTLAPAATVPIVSVKGKLYSIVLDEELDPERFLPTATISGPFRKEPA